MYINKNRISQIISFYKKIKRSKDERSPLEEYEMKTKEKALLFPNIKAFTLFKSHPLSVYLSDIDKQKTLSEAGDISIPTTLKRFLSFRLLPLVTQMSNKISIAVRYN